MEFGLCQSNYAQTLGTMSIQDSLIAVGGPGHRRVLKNIYTFNIPGI